MAIITTYVCDVSGVTGAKEDFVDVQIRANKTYGGNSYDTVIINKVIHKDVALKLNLVKDKVELQQPEPTFESKLGVLLREFVEEIAYEAGAEAASNYNRGG
jgi:hypothetical protein